MEEPFMPAQMNELIDRIRELPPREATELVRRIVDRCLDLLGGRTSEPLQAVLRELVALAADAQHDGVHAALDDGDAPDADEDPLLDRLQGAQRDPELPPQRRPAD